MTPSRSRVVTRAPSGMRITYSLTTYTGNNKTRGIHSRSSAVVVTSSRPS